MLKSLTKIVELSIFPFSYITFCYMYVGALLLSTYKFMSGHIYIDIYKGYTYPFPLQNVPIYL